MMIKKSQKKAIDKIKPKYYLELLQNHIVVKQR